MSLFLLYLLFCFLPNFSNVAEVWLPILVMGFIVSGGALVSCSIAAEAKDEDSPIAKLFLKPSKSWIIFCVIGILFVSIVKTIVPIERQLMYIAGGYAVTNNKELQKLPDNVIAAANAYLEKIKPPAAPEK